jgi:acyl-CoA reductase-like NAD-dependent aldehyde dehydrogenase
MKGPTVNTITHWIGGKPDTGTSTRTAPVYNPATGAQQAQLGVVAGITPFNFPVMVPSEASYHFPTHK